MKRFRTGVVAGFAVGYYLGAKAGRERYEQMRRKLAALRDLASERARQAREARHGGSDVDVDLESGVGAYDSSR